MTKFERKKNDSPLDALGYQTRTLQSIFSPAARRDTLRAGANFDRRDGELKMDWTKPGGLAGQLLYGY